jgi:hypothetical protein
LAFKSDKGGGWQLAAGFWQLASGGWQFSMIISPS